MTARHDQWPEPWCQTGRRSHPHLLALPTQAPGPLGEPLPLQSLAHQSPCTGPLRSPQWPEGGSLGAVRDWSSWQAGHRNMGVTNSVPLQRGAGHVGARDRLPPTWAPGAQGPRTSGWRTEGGECLQPARPSTLREAEWQARPAPPSPACRSAGYSPTQGPGETQTERKPTMLRPAYREDLILTSLLVPLLPRRHATDAVDRAPRGWCGPGDPRAGPSSPKGGDPLASPSLCAHLV